MKMEFKGEEPLSPSGQCLSSSVLCLTILGFLEFEVPIHDLQIFAMLRDLFLPINPRFSSRMTCENTGLKKWKQVQVDLQQHVKFPIFPKGKSAEVYDKYLDEYVSDMVMLPLPQTRPLWEVHVIKYQTTNAAGTLIFKLHHALGDGYSLIGALLSSLKRADNPSLPLTFPSRQSNSKNSWNNIFKRVARVFSCILDTALDFGSGLLRGKDDQTPIRSGDEGVEFRPINYTTLTFSLDDVKQIKDSLKVTVNDLIMGIILYGSRVYMEGEKHKSRKAASTALLVFSTRDMRNHTSVSEMLKPDSTTMPWGNHFTFSDVCIPKLMAAKSAGSYSDLENFLLQVHKATKRKKSSAAVYLNSSFIDNIRKCRGPEAAARYIHSRMKNSSLILSNLIGPVEQMALADHPVKGLYFTGSGAPVSLAISVMSYMGNLRVAIGCEKGFIDQEKLKLCIQKAYDTITTSVLQSK